MIITKSQNSVLIIKAQIHSSSQWLTEPGGNEASELLLISVDWGMLHNTMLIIGTTMCTFLQWNWTLWTQYEINRWPQWNSSYIAQSCQLTKKILLLSFHLPSTYYYFFPLGASVSYLEEDSWQICSCLIKRRTQDSLFLRKACY